MHIFFRNQFRFVFLRLAMVLLVPGVLFPQVSQPTSIEQLLNIKEEKPKSLFAVIPFKYRGLTENSALVFGNRFADDLKNILRFDSISPEKIQAFLVEANPDLLSCNDIDCGMAIARMFGARYYTNTQIYFENNRFEIIMNVVDIAIGQIVYKTRRNIKKDGIYTYFDNLSKKINANLPVEGSVIGAGKRKVIINVGAGDGLKLYDKVIVYNREPLDFYNPVDVKIDTTIVETVESDELIETEIKEETEIVTTEEIKFDDIDAALSVIEITRVELDKSEGLVKMTRKLDEPAKKGQSIKFYIDRFRQIQLYETARREIDRYNGWDEEQIKKPPPPVIKREETPPPVIVAIPLPIIERNEWIHKVRHWESERNTFRLMLVGSLVLGAATLYSYDTFSPVHLIPIGVAAYSAYAFFFSRAELNLLIQEGKYKGYIRTLGDSYLNPHYAPNQSPGIALNYRVHF